MNVPRVIIFVEGGNIQNICADGPVNVMTLGYDNAEACERKEDREYSSYLVETMTSEELDLAIEKTEAEMKEKFPDELYPNEEEE